MANANKKTRARDLMALFQLTAFEPIPADHEQTVANILRSYPPPEPARATKKAGKQ